MALNFPSNPVDGQVFGEYVYSTTRGAWKRAPVGSSRLGFDMGTTPPDDAKNGDGWIDPSDGALYVFYHDGTSGQWVAVSSTGDLSDILTRLSAVELSGPTTLPAGTIVSWGGVLAPTNWLICDGSAVSRTTYASLFSVIGTTYGAGDGSTTFNLPNMKGRIPVGRDAAQTEFDVLGETGGSKTNTLATNNLPQAAMTDAGTASNDTSFGLKFGTTAAYTAKSLIQQSIATQPVNNLQPYIILNFIIKATVGEAANESQLAARVNVLEQRTGSAAVRDAIHGVPANATERLALHNKCVQWTRTDTGWTEQYFTTVADGATAGAGAVAEAGWWPVYGALPVFQASGSGSNNGTAASWITPVSELNVGGFTILTGNPRVKVPIHGWYRISMQHRWQSNSTGQRSNGVTFDNVLFAGGTNWWLHDQRVGANESFSSVSRALRLDPNNANHHPGFQCWQSSGGALTYSSYMLVEYLYPPR